MKFNFSNKFKLQIELLRWLSILASFQLKFKYSFSWKISLCSNSFHSYPQISVLCQIYWVLMCYLQFLIYCSFSPEVSVINVFCICIGKNPMQFSLFFQTCSFYDSEKWIYRFPKEASLGKKTEDFFKLLFCFLLLVLQKTFILTWNTTRMSKYNYHQSYRLTSFLLVCAEAWIFF